MSNILYFVKIECSSVNVISMDKCKTTTDYYLKEKRCAFSLCKPGYRNRKIPSHMRDMSSVCKYCNHRYCSFHLNAMLHKCTEPDAYKFVPVTHNPHKFISQSGSGGANCAM